MRARISDLSDENAVGELLLASYTKLMADDYEQTTLAAALPRIIRANPKLLTSGTFYVVDGPDSSILGCGGWTIAGPGTDAARASDLAHLRHFATHPDFARRGIGRLIYDRCVDAAKLAGVKKLHAYSSLTAVAFYSRVGLEAVRKFDLQISEDVKLPAVLMEAKL